MLYSLQHHLFSHFIRFNCLSVCLHVRVRLTLYISLVKPDGRPNWVSDAVWYPIYPDYWTEAHEALDIWSPAGNIDSDNKTVRSMGLRGDFHLSQCTQTLAGSLGGDSRQWITKHQCWRWISRLTFHVILGATSLGTTALIPIDDQKIAHANLYGSRCILTYCGSNRTFIVSTVIKSPGWAKTVALYGCSRSLRGLLWPSRPIN